MFSTGFQSFAFQSAGLTNVPQATGGLPYTYVPAYQLREIEQRKKVKKTKTEAQKLESVLNEYERRKALAEESLLIAEQSERNRLMSVQNELITEINRLLMVKAELMARMKSEEEQLIMMMIIRRRRFRAF